MNTTKKIAKCALLLLAASILLSAAPQPAAAQWWGGYSPWTSRLWGYNPGFFGMFGYNNFYRYPGYRYWGYNNTPYYIAAATAPLMMVGSYFAQQSLMNNYFRNVNGGYNTRIDSSNYYPMPVQSMVSNGYTYTNGQSALPQTPYYQPGQPASYYPPAQQASYYPPVAPQAPLYPASQPGYLATSGSAIAPGSPMSQGFIDLVNTQYQGDLSRALSDPNVRSYARSVGLINTTEASNANLTPQKNESIRQMLSDSKEDSATKISAVRMLMTH